MLAGVTARMRLLSRAMNCRIMSRIWNSMSCGWSPTGTLVIPGRSISVRFSTEEHRGVSAGAARSSARSLQDPQSSPHFNSGPPKQPPFQLRIPKAAPISTQDPQSSPHFSSAPPKQPPFPSGPPKQPSFPFRTPKAALISLQDRSRPFRTLHFPSGPPKQPQFLLRTHEQPSHPFKPPVCPQAPPVSLQDPQSRPHFNSGSLTSLQDPQSSSIFP